MSRRLPQYIMIEDEAVIISDDTDTTCIEERSLWAECLTRALLDIIYYHTPTVSGEEVENNSSYSRKDYKSARLWLASDIIYIGSYIWICDTLDISSEDLRRVIEKYIGCKL